MNSGESEITAPHNNAGLDDQISSSRRGSVFLDILFYRTAFSDSGISGWPAFRESVPAQPVDATRSNRLIGQHFSQGTDLSELYSIKPKQDSVFRLY